MNEAPGITARRVTPGARLDGEFTYSVVVVAPASKSSASQSCASKSSESKSSESKSPASQAGGERRADGRMRTRLRDATLAEGRGRVLMGCRIRDKSRHGARLHLDKDRPLPKVFLLSDPAAKTCYRATLVWQAGRDAGVRLVGGK